MNNVRIQDAIYLVNSNIRVRRTTVVGIRLPVSKISSRKHRLPDVTTEGTRIAGDWRLRLTK